MTNQAIILQAGIDVAKQGDILFARDHARAALSEANRRNDKRIKALCLKLIIWCDRQPYTAMDRTYA